MRVLSPGGKDLIDLVNRHCKESFILICLIIAITVVFILVYFLVMLSVAKRDMHRYATLIKQKEATEQAERKSMRKSDAFSRASHDIRAALAGIIGLLDISEHDIRVALDVHATLAGRSRPSEIETILTKLQNNVKTVDGCAKDLLGKI